VFRITEGGDFESLHSFDFSVDGSSPVGVTLGSDGHLYGATFSGGASGIGTLFRIQTNGGGFQTFHSFSVLDDGGYSPRSPMIESGGNFYGTTYSGGAGGPSCPGGCGVVYEIDGSEILVPVPEPGGTACGCAAALALAARAERRRRTRRGCPSR
jgi:uncharacterized repeat protein (TIGR03803 family)